MLWRLPDIILEIKLKIMTWVGACCLYGAVENFEQGFWRETWREDLEDPGVDMKIILKWMLKKEKGKDVDWFYLTQDTKKSEILWTP